MKFEPATLFCISLITISFLLQGCDPPDVLIKADQDLEEAAVQVDFVRVNREDVANWMALSPDSYFSPLNPMREAAISRGTIYSVHLNVPSKTFQANIASRDPIWNRFGFDSRALDQGFDIVVFVDIPGFTDAGPDDPRRKLLPLYRTAWGERYRRIRLLTVHISTKGLFFDPEPTFGGTPPARLAADGFLEPEEAVQIFELVDLDQHPRRSRTVAPRFPAEFNRQGAAGVVRSRILIDPKGNARVVEILEATHSGAVAPVVEALNNWRFEPPVRNGQPVYANTIQPIHYDFK